jgi:hypothetical protein
MTFWWCAPWDKIISTSSNWNSWHRRYNDIHRLDIDTTMRAAKAATAVGCRSTARVPLSNIYSTACLKQSPFVHKVTQPFEQTPCNKSTNLLNVQPARVPLQVCSKLIKVTGQDEEAWHDRQSIPTGTLQIRVWNMFAQSSMKCWGNKMQRTERNIYPCKKSSCQSMPEWSALPQDRIWRKATHSKTVDVLFTILVAVLIGPDLVDL